MSGRLRSDFVAMRIGMPAARRTRSAALRVERVEVDDGERRAAGRRWPPRGAPRRAATGGDACPAPYPALRPLPDRGGSLLDRAAKSKERSVRTDRSLIAGDGSPFRQPTRSTTLRARACRAALASLSGSGSSRACASRATAYGLLAGLVHRGVGAQQGQRLGEARRRRSGRPSSSSQQPGVGRVGRTRGAQQHGQRRHALAQVGAGRLAGLVGVGGDVEDVVGELEGDADASRRTRVSALDRLGGAPPNIAPYRADGRDQRRRSCRRARRGSGRAGRRRRGPGRSRGSGPRPAGRTSAAWMRTASAPSSATSSEALREQEVAGRGSRRGCPSARWRDGAPRRSVGLVHDVVVVERREVGQLDARTAAVTTSSGRCRSPSSAASSTSSGRNRLPPASMRWLAASVDERVRVARRARRRARSTTSQPVAQPRRASAGVRATGERQCAASSPATSRRARRSPDELSPQLRRRSRTGPRHDAEHQRRQRRRRRSRPWSAPTACDDASAPSGRLGEEHQHDHPDVEERRDRAGRHADDDQRPRRRRRAAAANTANFPMKPAGQRDAGEGSRKKREDAGHDRGAPAEPGPLRQVRRPRRRASRTRVTTANAPIVVKP